MDRTIKLLAASSVVALTTTACAPNNGAPAYSQYQTPAASTSGTTTPSTSIYNGGSGGGNYGGGSNKAPVTHSHGGKVHSHALPGTGLRHTHATGVGGGYSGGYTQPQQTYVPRPQQQYVQRPYTAPVNTYRPPVQQQPGNNNGGVPHSHCGRVHSHALPPQGLAHTHGNPACPAGSAGGAQQQPYVNPQRGNAYQQQGQNNNAAGYDYAYGGGNTSGNAASPYDSTGGNTYDSYNGNTGGGAANGGNDSYYTYGGSGNQQGSGSNYSQPKVPSNYYDNKGSSSTYDYSAPSSGSSSGGYDSYTAPSNGGNSGSDTGASSGSFAPNNYSGGNSYTVQRGDTVFQVMRNTGVYWKDIIRLNNLQAPNYQINPGQTLKLK